ncbi:MAG TPA: cytochrome c oxidase assembly factor Coa1 family protein [Pyrinomonadaceae bacterium]
MNPNPAQFGGSFQQPQQPQQQKGCLGRNWKWMLPVGCLGLLLGVAALVGGIVLVAMSAIKSSEVYKGALGVVQTHPAAIERLGQPIKDGWFVSGNVKFDASGGNANFAIPVSGPKGSGTVHVRAVSPDGTWMYERLDLVVGTETTSLLDRNVVQPSTGSTVDVEEDADGSHGDASEDATGEATDADEAPTDAADGKTISGGVLNGKATSRPQPPYPPAARAARAQGVVVVQVTVDETGGVTTAKAVSGHPLLQPAAVAAAKQAKFSPTLLGGEPVKVSGMLIYNFVLDQ